MALLKLMYLATRNIKKKWTMPLQIWSITVPQLRIIFGEAPLKGAATASSANSKLSLTQVILHTQELSF